MRRIIGVTLGAVVYSVVLPLVALAQEGGSALGEPEGPTIAGAGGSNLGGLGGAGGTAFTGAEIAGLALAALVLAVIGISAVLMARRRSSAVRVEA